jgi:hypothetical protein
LAFIDNLKVMKPMARIVERRFAEDESLWAKTPPLLPCLKRAGLWKVAFESE